jgi:hypothetical protein
MLTMIAPEGAHDRQRSLIVLNFIFEKSETHWTDLTHLTNGRLSALSRRRLATMLVNQQLTHNQARTEAHDYAVAKRLLDTYQFGRKGTVPAHLLSDELLISSS